MQTLVAQRFAVPPTLDADITQAIKARIRSYVPPGTQLDNHYPAVVLSYASGRREGRDCEGAGPGMCYAAAFIDMLHECDVACFSGLTIPVGEDWKVFMLRLEGRKANAKVLIVLLTAAFFKSKPCLLEVNAAIENKVALVPVRLEETLPSKREQWAHLKSEEDEVTINTVQKSLGRVNAIPHPGTILSVPSALGEIFEKVGEKVGDLRVRERLDALAAAANKSEGKKGLQEARERAEAEEKAARAVEKAARERAEAEEAEQAKIWAALEGKRQAEAAAEAYESAAATAQEGAAKAAAKAAKEARERAAREEAAAPPPPMVMERDESQRVKHFDGPCVCCCAPLACCCVSDDGEKLCCCVPISLEHGPVDYILPLCLHTCLCPQQGGHPCPTKQIPDVEESCVLENLLANIVLGCFQGWGPGGFVSSP